MPLPVSITLTSTYISHSTTDTAIFTLTKVANKRFDIQHYFLPIKSSEIMLNTQLVQAPYY